MTVKIIVDSACDIPQQQGEELGIKILPLRYLLGEEEFLDGVTISNTEFYEKLEGSDLFPKTSQITPYQYEKAFEEALEECDEVLCMTMSSGVSGCYQSARMGREDFDDKVLVFDSRHFCFSYTVLVKYAVMLRDQGLSAAEIYAKLTEALGKVRIIAAFDTLEYLKMGGLISCTASAIGTVLGIKPIITITDGKVDVLKLARGTKKSYVEVNRYMAKGGEIDLDMPFVCGYTGTSSVRTDNFMKEYGNKYFNKEVEELVVGTTVGSYAGPKAFALAYFVK